MRYRGLELDPESFWSQYVEIRGGNKDSEFMDLTYCPNPNHPNSNTPAFQINRQKPLVHCFSECGISGTYAWAISRIEGCSVAEAEAKIRQFLKLSGAKLARREKRKPKEEQQKKVESIDEYSYLPPNAIAYLESRGINGDSVSKFKLGFDREEERIVIPAYDERGRVKFLIKRAIWNHQRPKYLYSEGAVKTSLLFGACFLDLELVYSHGIIVVEGSLDTIKLHQHGLRNTVGILGARVSEKQMRLIHNFHPRQVYFMFDRDSAGISALFAAKRSFQKTALFVCRYPKGKFDPAELTKREANRVIEKAIPLRVFQRELSRR